jgi:Zn-dependent protease
MKWSWRIGRLAGINVYVHWTMILLLAWIAMLYTFSGGTVVQALYGIVLVAAFFLCIVLHELGHALTARQFGIGTLDIILLPIGGVARLEDIPDDPRQELWIAIAGPVVSVAIAAVLFVVLWSLGQIHTISLNMMLGGSFLASLFVFNVVVVLFNLLPAFPMDGGRVLRALLSMRMDRVRATRIAAGAGQMMAILFGLVGLFINPLLLLIAIFVYLGAEAEAQQAEFKATTKNATVRDVMMTRFRTLPPDASLQDAARELLAGAQQDFPVVDGDRLRGLLYRNDLVRGLAQPGDHLAVRDVMTAEVDAADSSDALDGVLARLRQSGRESIPVVHEDKLVGLLTLQNVGEFAILRAALWPGPARSSANRPHDDGPRSSPPAESLRK